MGDIQKKRKQLFVRLSLLILLLDVVFVAINYKRSKATLLQTLQMEAETAGKIYTLHIENVFTNMMQLATYIGNTKELNQLFLQGKEAVDREGGGAGSKEAAQARQELLEKIKPSWDVMMNKFNVRQLHYHIGPGSISYLRVHKPEKFGDKMHDIRHIIVDTNQDHLARYGFETGGIYSGLRAVVPIFADAEDTRVHVGALEVGTSFEQPIQLIKKTQGFDLLVLLKKEHVNTVMWQDYIAKRFSTGLELCDSVLESSTLDSDVLAMIVSEIKQNNGQYGCATNQVNLIDLKTRSLISYILPLYDYQNQANNEFNPVGFIMIIKDVSRDIENFRHSVMMNMIYALLAFLLIEIVFIYSLRVESKISSLRHESRHDGLTGLPNRRDYENVLRKEINRNKRDKLPISFILIDVDNFKKYNDLYGHSMGDSCLQKVATSLKNSLSRAGDYLARIGGEEFAAILPNTNIYQAEKAADKMRVNIEKLNLEHKNNVAGIVTISLGLVTKEDANVTTETIFKTADESLYAAKQQGRNRIVSKML